jgi:hypothetical protein
VTGGERQESAERHVRGRVHRFRRYEARVP